jgi:hypothetical protein
VTDPERTETEAFHEALRQPASKWRDLGRLALRLSLLALAGLVVIVLLLAMFDVPASESRGNVVNAVLTMAFLACLLLATAGPLLGLVALLQPGGRVLQCLGAVLLGLLAWPLALLMAFIAAGGAGAPGRAMRVGGVRVLPRVVRGRGKRVRRASSEYEPDPTLVPDRTRRLLATLWLEDARAEHASVDAFEHLAMDLLAAGAPEHLVAGARRAALEEVGHAAICFAVASAYAGRDLRASTAPLAPRWKPSAACRDALLRRLALESLLDGCIEEAVAADAARLGAQHAVDPAIHRTLARIAREEAGHAGLAWAIVDWAVREEPSLLPALSDALQGARPRLRSARRDTDAMLQHGRLAASRTVALALLAHGRAADRIAAQLSAVA